MLSIRATDTPIPASYFVAPAAVEGYSAASRTAASRTAASVTVGLGITRTAPSAIANFMNNVRPLSPPKPRTG